jgi:DNA modification methylase
MQNTKTMIENKQLSRSLPEEIVNIDKKSRSNLFTWRGQFSPQLIESLLKAYANESSNVFDPFLGSGTVLYESGLLGLKAIGCEINPAAIAFAKIYELLNEPIKSRLESISYIEDFLSSYTTDLPLIPSKSVAYFENDILNLYKICNNPVTKRILTALIVGFDFGVKIIDTKRVVNVWNSLKSTVESLPYSEKTIMCIEADARKSRIKDNTFDLVITSPPYINVFNYHQNYRKSVEMLGIDILAVARSEIGSNRKFRGNRFLTVTQYCMDMAQVFEELKRVCIPEAKIIFVVGRESNVKKTAFFNAELLKDVAISCGLVLEGQQHRVFGNKFGQSIYEEILRFSISEKSSTVDAVERARNIGIQALSTALKSASIDVVSELIEAVEKARTIKPSPYLGE